MRVILSHFLTVLIVVKNVIFRDVHFDLERMAAQAGHTQGSLLFGAAAAGLKQLGGHLGELVPCLTIGGDNR